MTLLTKTTTSYDVGTGGGLREDLEDVIWDLFPMDTWAVTNLDRTKATGTYHEWLKDALAGSTANRQLEGDDAAFATITAPSRMGNYLQISRKTFLISGTMEAVSKAGRKSELVRQGMKQMKELKRDMEQALIGNQASSAGGVGTARSCGGMESWIASTDHGGNGVRATTTASSSTIGFSSGVVTAPTDGSSTGAFTQTLLTDALGLAWIDGGNPSVILVGSSQKAALDAFAGISSITTEVGKKPATIVNTARYFISDFGEHEVVLSRYMRSSVVLCIDPDYWAVAFLPGRTPFMETLAKTGDGEKRQILTEFTLVARNPDASAKVVACT